MVECDSTLYCQMPAQGYTIFWEGTMNNKRSIVLLCSVFLTACSGSVPKLGVNSEQLLSCPNTPNCLSSHLTDTLHFIKPLLFVGTAQGARDRLLQVLTTFDRTNILDAQENYIRVEFTSALFRFVDDVEFYISADYTDEVLINVRSASRIGLSDLGANRKRIEQIRAQF